MREKRILEIARYIIENNATIAVTAKKFNLSTSSIKKYINNDLPNMDLNIYKAVKEVQDKLIEIGRTVGGINGKREPKYNDFEAREIAEVMIEGNLTLDEASKIFSIPRSTIYERIRDVDDRDIQNALDILFASTRGDKSSKCTKNEKIRYTTDKNFESEIGVSFSDTKRGIR